MRKRLPECFRVHPYSFLVAFVVCRFTFVDALLVRVFFVLIGSQDVVHSVLTVFENKRSDNMMPQASQTKSVATQDSDGRPANDGKELYGLPKVIEVPQFLISSPVDQRRNTQGSEERPRERLPFFDLCTDGLPIEPFLRSDVKLSEDGVSLSRRLLASHLGESTVEVVETFLKYSGRTGLLSIENTELRKLTNKRAQEQGRPTLTPSEFHQSLAVLRECGLTTRVRIRGKKFRQLHGKRSGPKFVFPWSLAQTVVNDRRPKDIDWVVEMMREVGDARSPYLYGSALDYEFRSCRYRNYTNTRERQTAACERSRGQAYQENPEWVDLPGAVSSAPVEYAWLLVKMGFDTVDVWIALLEMRDSEARVEATIETIRKQVNARRRMEGRRVISTVKLEKALARLAKTRLIRCASQDSEARILHVDGNYLNGEAFLHESSLEELRRLPNRGGSKPRVAR